MNELHEAFKTLELPPGSSFEEVKRAHKKFTHVWHPDRVPESMKDEAGERLKKYNHARDVLRSHFKSAHKESGCACQEVPAAAASSSSHSGKQPFHGAASKEAERTEEDIAREMDEQRKKRKEKQSAQESQRQEASSKEAEYEDQVSSAYSESKKVDKHRSLLKISKIAALGCLGSMFFFYFYRGYLEGRSGSLNGYQSSEQLSFQSKNQAYLNDKFDYLRKNVRHEVFPRDAERLRPPFEQNFEAIALGKDTQNNSSAMPPVPQVTETDDYEDRQQKEVLKSMYAQRSSKQATIDMLKEQESVLETARKRAGEDARAVDDFERALTNIRLRIANRREDLGRTIGKINEIERGLLKRRGANFLPKIDESQARQPEYQETGFDMLKRTYPQYF